MKSNNPNTLNDVSSLCASIQGLVYIPDYLNEDEEKIYWNAINQEVWIGDLQRRVQHYGYKYDYKAKAINHEMKIGTLPCWVNPLTKRLSEEGHINELPDQLIVNEYLPGQGISSHIDCVPCFDSTIISISLGSPCIMNFIHKQTKQKIEVLLEPRSLVILKDAARYEWTHGIAGRKSDTFQGKKIERSTRLSLTFRNVILH